ncbi:hypothetical protein KFJ24_02410 [Marinobacter sediminum]|uniref:DUF6647 family protein n=1 Tax=Marinobacter sediminum TaxID=256323 RepID=UPI00202F3F90|nr:DUF6647 family protein [Marinobacter sediminum]MCM0611326.1 hypothetical protein [Marinobacter sediminum]
MARLNDGISSRLVASAHTAIKARMLFIWLLLLPGAAPVADTEFPNKRDTELDELTSELSGWVVQQTDYLEPALPGHRFETQANLQELCFPGFSHDLMPRILGAYDARSTVIYLNTDFDSDDLLDISYLLHELVHHFQTQNLSAKDKRFKAPMEAEALRMQLMWLEENGVSDGMTKLGVDEKSLGIMEALSW